MRRLLALGVAHWRFGNVDWRVVSRIAVPGAFAGATFLSSISTEAAAPWMAGILFLLGVHLLVRFPRPLRAVRPGRPLRTRFLAPVGPIAGSTPPAVAAGDRWPPPSLLVSGPLEPRTVIGSVDTSEVVAAASIGFLIGLGSRGLPAARWTAELVAAERDRAEAGADARPPVRREVPVAG